MTKGEVIRSERGGGREKYEMEQKQSSQGAGGELPRKIDRGCQESWRRIGADGRKFNQPVRGLCVPLQ